jgi:hypothetical protein
MEGKVNWSKIKIPSFGMSDAMVKFKNGKLNNIDFDNAVTNFKQVKIKNGKKR